MTNYIHCLEMLDSFGVLRVPPANILLEGNRVPILAQLKKPSSDQAIGTDGLERHTTDRSPLLLSHWNVPLNREYSDGEPSTALPINSNIGSSMQKLQQHSARSKYWTTSPILLTPSFFPRLERRLKS